MAGSRASWGPFLARPRPWVGSPYAVGREATRTSTGCSTSSSRPPGPGWPPDRYALGGGAAPRGHRRRARACAHRAVRPGDGQEPQHRAAGLAADLRPPGRGPEPQPRAGAARTTRRAPGSSSRGTAPTSRRRSCGRESRARTTRARLSGTTCCSASSTARCRTERASSPPYTRRASTCRGRVTTTSPCETRPPNNGGG